MPQESIGIDYKMAAVDLDPKTYSPMSTSDENMSSPPSVLTTASAGSCTPSSLPSAGSTPSSIPSAGSTPYQFVSQEESQIIKPVTPEINPYTPEPSISYHTMNFHSLTPSLPEQNAANEPPDAKKVISHTLADTSSELSKIQVCPNISDDVNQRKEGCTCMMCDDKCGSTCETNANKRKIESASDLELVKGRKRKYVSTKKTYKSELSADPQTAGIKLKIKLTSSSTKSSQTNPKPTLVPKKRGPKGKRKGRKSVSKAKYSPKPSTSCDSRKQKRNLLKFTHWGPILAEVQGEQQSGWGYNLPPEILRQIFRNVTETEGCIPFLSRASEVCRLWREVASDPIAWHDVDLTSKLVKSRFRNERKLLWIVENRLARVKDLNLGGWVEAVSPAMLQKICQTCTSLQSLNLSSCYKLHAEYLHNYLLPLKSLRKLDLTNVMGAHKPTPRCAVGQQTMADLASYMKERLTDLVIANNTLSNVSSIIHSISENCPELVVLDLSSVETTGRDYVRFNVEKLQRGCPKLRVLRLANCLFRLTEISVAVQVLSPGFPELEELSLAVEDRVNTGMNDSELERILKNSNKLKLLDVRGCHNITDSSLVRIPPWDLEHLFLAGGSTYKSYSDRLELVVKKWQHSLEEFDLSWTGSSEAVDTAIDALVEDNNDKLRSLNMRGSAVTFGPIRRLLSKCSQLQCLNLTSCHALPRGVKRNYSNRDELEKFHMEILKGRFCELVDEA